MDQELIQLVMRREKHQYDVLLELELAGMLTYGKHGLIAVFAALMLVMLVCGGWFLKLPYWLLALWCLLIFTWSVWMLAWIRIGLPRYEQEMDRRIAKAGIAEHLAAGTDWIEEIYAYTAWPLSLFFLGARPRKFKGWVRLLAMNIDWYMGEKRRLFRPEWIMMAFQWILPFTHIFFITLLRRTNQFEQHNLGIYSILVVIMLIAAVMAPSLIKRKAAAGLLYKQMQERFDA